MLLFCFSWPLWDRRGNSWKLWSRIMEWLLPVLQSITQSMNYLFFCWVFIADEICSLHLKSFSYVVYFIYLFIFYKCQQWRYIYLLSFLCVSIVFTTCIQLQFVLLLLLFFNQSVGDLLKMFCSIWCPLRLIQPCSVQVCTSCFAKSTKTYVHGIQVTDVFVIAFIIRLWAR